MPEQHEEPPEPLSPALEEDVPLPAQEVEPTIPEDAEEDPIEPPQALPEGYENFNRLARAEVRGSWSVESGWPAEVEQELWGHNVVAYALRLCENHRADAEDLLQEAWIRISRGEPQQFDHPWSRNAWVKAVVRNAYITEWRKRKVRHWDHDAEDVADPAVRLPTGPDVEELADRIFRRRDLARAVGNLSEKLRVVVMLAIDLETGTYPAHSLREIAATLGIPVGTVKSRLFAALRNMRENLGDWNDEGDGGDRDA